MAAKNKWSSWQHVHLEGNLFSADVLELISKGEAPAQSSDAYQLPSGVSVMDKVGLSYKTAKGLYADYKRKISAGKMDQWDLTRDFIVKFFFQCLEWRVDVIRKLDADSRSFPIRRIAFGRIPIITSPGESSLDKPESRYAITNGQKSVSAFQMMQQYLTAAGASRWGIVANGAKLRLLRSSTALSKPQYLEFDLGAILEDDFYSEYSLLWRFFHVSRIRNISDDMNLEIWEEWRKTAIDSGERIRDKLRVGVSRALQILGTGFLKDNTSLRDRIQNGILRCDDYYHQLLRLVYRFLFLFVTEERYSEKGIRLIFNPSAEYSARDAYDKGYSLSRLKPIIRQVRYRNAQHDLWEVQKVVFRALGNGEPLLALPALGGMFSESVCPDISNLILSNKCFLEAMECLRWSVQDGRPFWIDYKNLGTQELGSVYESLLEMIPIIDSEKWTFRFIDFDDEETNAGNSRKTTGSYYTPDFLVDQLIKTALIPTIEEKLQKSENAEKAILDMSIVDPACGSGHFLIAAASTLAVYLSRVRGNGDTITGYREAYRDVISNCIYGVDINPMAVELTRMALWLEGYEPGKPLSFLDSHIKCGNSLMGVFDLAILYDGIPSDAFNATDIDDKELCTLLKKKNQKDLKSLKNKNKGPDLFQKTTFHTLADVDVMPETTHDEVVAKRQAYAEYEKRLSSSRMKTAADYYMSAFFAKKNANSNSIPNTTQLLNILSSQPAEWDSESLSYAKQLSLENKFFHWKLEFPLVFKKGGFDVVLGNPPWDKVKLKDEEFFASRVPEIANAQNGSKRKKLINELKNGDESQQRIYQDYKLSSAGYLHQSTFVHVDASMNGQYSLSGKGDVNMYALFTELASKIVSDEGSIGVVVPTGIATDDSTKDLFRYFVDRNLVDSVYDFENGNSVEIINSKGKRTTIGSAIFPAVHRSYKFSLITFRTSENPDFAFFLHDVKELEDERRHYPLSAEDIKLMNPNTLTLPLIRSKKDYDIVRKIYQNSVVVWDDNKEDGNTFNLKIFSMFHMTNDSHLFLDSPTRKSLPLYEGKFIQLYDYRFNSYEGERDGKGNPVESYVPESKKKDPNYEIIPQYWIDEKEVLYIYSDAPQDIKDAWRREEPKKKKKQDKTPSLFPDDVSNMTPKQLDEIVRSQTKKWCLGFRDISNATNKRTVIMSLFPLAGVGNPINMIRGISLEKALLLASNASSFIFDYIARNKIGGTHVNQFYFKQLPVIASDKYTLKEKEFIVSCAYELFATSKKMADALGCDVYDYDEDRRSVLKARLDAFYALKYGLSRSELEYVLDPEAIMGKGYPTVTFPAIKADDIAQYGEYRTKHLILESYDELMEHGIWGM